MKRTKRFVISDHVLRATRVTPYERQRGDPLYRPLRIYTLDPSRSRFVGAQATVNVPYEPLAPGPTSALFEVIDYDKGADCRYRPVDLEDPRTLMRGGLTPSATDHLFHQQMVYAVATKTYWAFRRALGRNVHWGFGRGSEGPTLLRIYPHWKHETNAYYDNSTGAVRFGYYEAKPQVAGRNLPGGIVFTCLSHDVVTHEMTHALLDGLRPHFIHPTHSDVLALHEALGDLVAVFQHFSYADVVAASIEQAGTGLTDAGLLTDLATQFGQTIGKGGPLRTAIDRQRATGIGSAADGQEDNCRVYNQDMPSHQLGSVLVSAVFDAFNEIFQRKTRGLVRLASGGTGVLPPGDLPVTLQEMLARQASDLASQFLSICIRAIDYCPPVDVNFGDYLRALLTADFDLVPDDHWGYREALIDAFRRRAIYPSDVRTLAEESLLWKPPPRPIRRRARLSFEKLEFKGDPGNAMGPNELQGQATELGELMTEPAYVDMFGLVLPDDPQLQRDPHTQSDRFELPSIESVRTSRRVGPDGRVVFDLIAEVVQTRWVHTEGGGRYPFLGGSTIIFGPDGDVRYCITKNILSRDRLARQLDPVQGPALRDFWQRAGATWQPKPRAFQLLHQTDTRSE